MPDDAPADATLTLAKATPFFSENGPPAPLKTPADDDPLLDAFDAARSEAVAARLGDANGGVRATALRCLARDGSGGATRAVETHS